MFDVFVSYAHVDRDWVRSCLVPRLKAANLEVWVDYESIQSGKDLVSTIEEGIRGCRWTLIVASPAYLESGFSQFESSMAQVRDLASGEERVLAIKVAPCELPLRFMTKSWIDFTSAADPQEAFDKLLATLRGAPTQPIAGQDGGVESYREKLRKTFGFWEQHYTPLKVAHDFKLSPWAGNLDQEIEARKDQKTLSICEALDKHGKLVIVGDAGAGKTTSLRRLALELAKAEGPSAELPVFVELPRYVRLVEHGVARQRYDEILRLAEQAVGSPDLMRSLLARSRVVFLFDGLNEVAEPDREECALGLLEFMERHAAHRFVVTSRRYGFANRLRLPVYEIRDLSLDEIAGFVARYLDQESTDRLLGELPSSLRFLATNPLALRMMISVFECQGHIPNNRGGLLKAYVTQSLRRETDEKHQAAGQDRSTAELRHEILIPLGYSMQTEGQHLLRSRVEEIVSARLRTLGQAGVAASKAIDELVHTGLLQPVGIDKLRFWHQSIQEYFAGERLRQIYTAARDADQAWRAIRSYVDNSHWHEALALMAGLLVQPQLTQFLSRCGRRHEQLAAMCIANSDAVPRSLVTAFIEAQRRRVLRWLSISPWTVKMAWFWIVFPVFLFSSYLQFVRTGEPGINWTWLLSAGGTWEVGLRVLGRRSFVVAFPVQRLADWYFRTAPDVVRLIWNSIGAGVVSIVTLALVWWMIQTVLVRGVLRRRIAPPVSALRMLGTSEARVVVSSLAAEARQSTRVHPRYSAFLEASQLASADAPEGLTRILLEDDLALRGLDRFELAAPSTFRQLESLAGSDDDVVALRAMRALSQLARGQVDCRDQAVSRLASTVQDRSRSFWVRYGAFRSLRGAGEGAGSRPWPTMNDVRDFWLRHWLPIVMATISVSIATAALLLAGVVRDPTVPLPKGAPPFENSPLLLLTFLLVAFWALWRWRRGARKWNGSYGQALYDIFAMALWPITAVVLVVRQLRRPWQTRRAVGAQATSSRR